MVFHRAQRVLLFVVVLQLAFSGEIFSQQREGSTLFDIQKQEAGIYRKPGSRQIRLLPRKPLFFSRLNFPVVNQRSTTPLPANYYNNCLGFICRSEWKLEKAIQIPLRFRLGSLAYVNYLERKPNATLP